MTKLEIEKKFLIKFPLSFESMKEVWAHSIKVEDINQFYLKAAKGVTDRIRLSKEFGSGAETYLRTKKIAISPGISEEEEFVLTEKEYNHFIESADDLKHPILKTRYTFDYNDQIFELDVFHKRVEGLSILEIELDDINDKVNLPPFLCVIEEVTGIKKYKNSKLALLSSTEAKELINAH